MIEKNSQRYKRNAGEVKDRLNVNIKITSKTVRNNTREFSNTYEVE